jgi:hypothetical protein
MLLASGVRFLPISKASWGHVCSGSSTTCLVQYRFGPPERERAISSTSCEGSQSLNRTPISRPPSPPRFVVKKLNTKFRVGRPQPMRIHVQRVEPGATSDVGGAIRGRKSPFADRRSQRLGRDQDKGHSKGRPRDLWDSTRRLRLIAGYLFAVRVNLHFRTGAPFVPFSNAYRKFRRTKTKVAVRWLVEQKNVANTGAADV